MPSAILQLWDTTGQTVVLWHDFQVTSGLVMGLKTLDCLTSTTINLLTDKNELIVRQVAWTRRGCGQHCLTRGTAWD